MVLATEVQPLIFSFFVIDSQSNLRSREVEIDFRVRIRLENDSAGRKDFCLLKIEVLDTGDDARDFRTIVPKVGVSEQTSGEPPAFADAVFKVGEQSHLEVRVDADAVIGFCYEASVPEDVEQSRREVASDVSRSVDEMDAGAEVGLQAFLASVEVEVPGRGVAGQTEEADSVVTVT